MILAVADGKRHKRIITSSSPLPLLFAKTRFSSDAVFQASLLNGLREQGRRGIAAYQLFHSLALIHFHWILVSDGFKCGKKNISPYNFLAFKPFLRHCNFTKSPPQVQKTQEMYWLNWKKCSTLHDPSFWPTTYRFYLFAPNCFYLWKWGHEKKPSKLE